MRVGHTGQSRPQAIGNKRMRHKIAHLVIMAIRGRLLVLFSIGWVAARPPSLYASSLSDWQSELSLALGESKDTNAVWGVEVVRATDGKLLFETNSTQRFVPASNTKLFVAALALDHLGTNYQVSTSLEVTHSVGPDGTVEGDLIVTGRGDPSFSPTWHSGKWLEAFAPLVELVQKAGIRHIQGDLIVDDHAFHGPLYGKGWDEEDSHFAYGAPVGALTAGDNLLEARLTPGLKPGDPATVRWIPIDEFTVSSAHDAIGFAFSNLVTTSQTNQTARVDVGWGKTDPTIELRGRIPVGGHVYNLELPISSPAVAFGGYLMEALARNQVSISGMIRPLGDPPAIKTTNRLFLGSVLSPPLGKWVRPTFKDSQNMYAQMLLLTVGESVELRGFLESTAHKTDATADLALRRLNPLLVKIGIGTNDVGLEEGSGLSRGNWATPHAINQLLGWTVHQPFADCWIDSLAVGGVDGTLRRRLTNPLVRGKVRAKTGSLTGVSALSGYVTNKAGEGLIFSILVNHWSLDSSAECRAEIDHLVELMAGGDTSEDW